MNVPSYAELLRMYADQLDQPTKVEKPAFTISLRAARINAGYETLDEAVEALGFCCKTSLCHYEHNPDLIKAKYYARFAKVYGIPQEYIRFTNEKPCSTSPEKVNEHGHKIA